VSFRWLAMQGVGALTKGIFWTVSPYRELIGELYARFDTEPEQQRDSKVYAELLGEGRSLAEVVATAELSALPLKSLQHLMPATSPEDLKKLQRLARFWGPPSDEEVGLVSDEKVELALAELFKPEDVWLIKPDLERCDFPLPCPDLSCFGVGQRPGTHKADKPIDYPETHLLWANARRQITIKQISNAVETVMECRKKSTNKAKVGSQPVTPRVFLLGPGTEELELDASRRVAVLRLVDACQAAWEGDLVGGLRRKARDQLRLTAFSPFQTSGALPPGSPLFRGREEELGFIKLRIRKVSVLIVGSRRVGKTSLLNQIYHWAKGEPDLEPLRVDLQGVEKDNDFLAALASEAENEELSEAT
jgi:hypothetical protein